jgi:hypothetical protein
MSSKIDRAIEELEQMIARRYPTATFAVTRAADEPENVHLVTTVDLEDPDEMLDLVMDRLLELQIDERVPVHVIPIRPPERTLSSAQQPTPRRTPILGSIVSRPA